MLDPSEHRAGRAHTPRILLAALVALLMAYVSIALAPRVLNGDGVAAPLDRCVTEQSVLKFLDGKLVQSGGPVDGAGRGVETITVRKEHISSLKVQPKTYGSQVIVVQFNLDHEGRQLQIESSFDTHDQRQSRAPLPRMGAIRGARHLEPLRRIVWDRSHHRRL